MNKIAFNNEIVLMRQCVRQARVSVVRKLSKETKLLEKRKHGDEKVLEKCKRKAQKLVAEIEALKRLKDDEISKFGIKNSRNLQEVLNDASSDAKTRIKTRLAFHKILSDRINKFKEKFPDYEQYLGSARKKLPKLQKTSKMETKNDINECKKHEDLKETVCNDSESQNEENLQKNEAEDSEEDRRESTNDLEDSESEKSVENSEIEEEDMSDRLENDFFESESFSIRKIKVSDEEESKKVEKIAKKPEKRKETEVTSKEAKGKRFAEISDEEESKKVEKASEKSKIIAKTEEKPEKQKEIKVISKEAKVKRFAELSDEENDSKNVKEPSEMSTKSKKRLANIEKEVDSFFMTENGDSEYLSVALPKTSFCNNEEHEQDERFSQNHAAKRQKTFEERNNKFFSKISSNRSFGINKLAANTDKRKLNSNRGSNFPPNRKTEVKGKTEAAEENLHPSWMARKKQQEILKEGFKGKKIVFDF